jgi:transcriptional regulator with XRE-family HTH domain
VTQPETTSEHDTVVRMSPAVGATEHEGPVAPAAGERIRGVRKQLGMSRRSVARAAGFSRRELTSLERGRREPSMADWRCLAGSLGVELDDLAPADVLARDAEETQDDRIDEFLGDLLPDGTGLTLAMQALESTPDESETGVYRQLPTGDGDYRARRARKRVERQWRDLRARIDPVSEQYDRVMRAGPGDDLHELLAELEEITHTVRTSPAFVRNKARHRTALDHYRGGITAEAGTGA